MEGLELYNRDAEEAFVGALFLDKELVKECTISPNDLYLPNLRLIYSAIRSADGKGKPIDNITIIEELGLDNLQMVGGASYLASLVNSVPTTANFHFYEQLVREYAQKRKAIQIAGRIMEQARSADIHEVLSDGIQALMAVEEEQMDDDNGDFPTALADLYAECEQDVGEIAGVPSGFTDLDKLTGGFQESDLIIIGARPSMGKTAFALHLALHAAVADVSAIFSLEMSKKQLTKRMIGMTGKIDSWKMKNPRRMFQEDDWEQLTGSMGRLSTINLHIFEKAGMDVPYIWSKARRLRREYGADKRLIIVIDYLQLIEGKNKMNRQAEISEISRALKTMARELNVVVIALSQLSRGVEMRQDKRPILSDLRESGQIEQDADLIAFLYRDDYYSPDSKKKGQIEVILAKHRNGPIGTVELGFHKPFGLFFNFEPGKPRKVQLCENE